MENNMENQEIELKSGEFKVIGPEDLDDGHLLGAYAICLDLYKNAETEEEKLCFEESIKEMQVEIVIRNLQDKI